MLQLRLSLKSRVKFNTQLGFMFTMAARKCLIQLNTNVRNSKCKYMCKYVCWSLVSATDVATELHPACC